MIAELGELEEFREEVRGWCAKHVPTDWVRRMAGVSMEESLDFQREWLTELRKGGFAAPHWSAEWTGRDFTLEEQVVIAEEMARARAPRLGGFFVSLYHTYGLLVASGTEEQRRRHLPAILNGEIWCQGFSEPSAGSDLAALRTRAERRGDAYVVNGQKVWSTHAMHAQFCLLLARTDPDASKHRGISYFLLDMQTPGIEVRPIRDLGGREEFCELFLTDVEIPVESRIGEENEGWRIANYTLATERSTLLLMPAEQLRVAYEMLVDLARSTPGPGGRPAIEDVGVRRDLADFHAEIANLRLLINRMLTQLIRAGGAGPESSIIKLYYSELLQRFTRYATELGGMRTQELAPLLGAAPYVSGVWEFDFLNSYTWTISAGTSEIQRNIISEQVLGMPREPR
ncbi:MAG: acyl-CoA dehydrogenase family protein [Myxococcota bacterium]|nr:acyl-CoA dehydrogenase family protein [Myxococcota bacterium]